MTETILILNGPNLNLFGTREPEIYGTRTLADAEAECRELCAELNVEVDFRQSNHEGELVDWIQEAESTAAGIIINPAAYSHTSIAIMDALKAYSGAVVEVHVSNIYRREPFRHHSYASSAADAVIAGCGLSGYAIALRHIVSLLP